MKELLMVTCVLFVIWLTVSGAISFAGGFCK